jgi:hypothetical protein
MLIGIVSSALPTLIRLQGLLNLQYLPAQLTDLVQNIALAVGWSVPQVSAAFLAGELTMAPFWFALGRVTA